MTWQEIKTKYAADPEVQQLLAVECIGGSNAKVRYYVKQNGGWWLLHRGTAFIGKNGLGKTREGDAMTPEGDFRPIIAFGIKPNPGCQLPYIDVTVGTVACDAEGQFYNRIVKFPDYCDICGPDLPGEKMWQLSPEYDFGIQTDYNADNIYPLGSAIFIHCKGAKTWTGGCVALDKRLMRQILQTATAGLVISIH